MRRSKRKEPCVLHKVFWQLKRQIQKTKEKWWTEIKEYWSIYVHKRWWKGEIRIIPGKDLTGEKHYDERERK